MIKYQLLPVYDKDDVVEKKKKTRPSVNNAVEQQQQMANIFLSSFPEKEIKQAFSKKFTTKVNKWIKKLKKGFNKKYHIEKNTLNIVYDDNVVGSNIVQMLQFFIVPRVSERLGDMKQFYYLCEDLKVPKGLLKKYHAYVKKSNVHVLWKQI